MAEKRLFNGPSYATIFFTSLFFIGFFSLWLLSGFSTIFINFSHNLFTLKNFSRLSKSNFRYIQSYFNNDIPIDDMFRLIDIKDFKFTINHSCNLTEPYLLIIIHSAPANLKKRNVIRETWGKKISSISTYFLVGFSEKYKNTLEKEDKKYKDLIQGNFIDSYRNMTYKHVMGLKWVAYYCSHVKYILKLDDDVFVHVTAILDFLKEELLSVNTKRLILCDAISTSKVKRSWRSKWRVSPEEYPEKEYPSYCAGWAILYSIDAIFVLYQEAQKEPFFWIDDVHVTGTLAKKANVTQTSIRSMILSERTMKSLLKENNTKKRFFFGPPNLPGTKIRALYNMINPNVTN